MAQIPLFLQLPTEIRLQIYGHLYVPPEGQYPVEASFPIWGQAPIWLHRLESYRGDLYPACNSTKRAFWSILQVCKTINQEVTDLLFERVLFTVFMPNSMIGVTLSAGPPKLGRAKDFTFWQRARRILIVSIDDRVTTMRDLVRNLGVGLRCFQSTPLDTTAYLYLHDETELAVPHNDNNHRSYPKEWQRSLKSFGSLSKRMHMEFEIRTREEEGNARERALQLAEAANASLTFQTIARQKSMFPRFGEEMHVQSTSRYERSSEAISTSDVVDETVEKGRQRIICCMTSRARSIAGRSAALQRRKERMMRKKWMYEGRLG